jgi:hypothetical protein
LANHVAVGRPQRSHLLKSATPQWNAQSGIAFMCCNLSSGRRAMTFFGQLSLVAAYAAMAFVGAIVLGVL